MPQGDLAYLELKNFDEMFYEDPDAKIIPCGAEASVQKDLMKAQIETFFHDGSKELTNISSCECGYLSGNFWEGTKTVCPKCHTEVKTNFADELKFKTWLEIPNELPPILHPVVYGVLDNWLGSFKKAGRVLPTLLNVKAVMPPEYRGVLQQGFTFFYDHFWDIINWFATQYKKFQSASERKKTDLVLQFLEKFKDRLFFRHIPILNSSLHLLTKSGTMNLADTVVKYIARAKLELHMLIFMMQCSTCTQTRIETGMYDIYTSVLDYTLNIMSVKLLKKPGFIRKQLLGARLHCTARAVIVPIPGIHQADEVYLPWLEAIALYALEILNVLMNRERLTLPEALKRLTWATARFDPDIHRILMTLIDECPEKGLPLIIGRNPSLRLGAMFLLYATRIKTEYEDVTLSISPLIASAPNLNLMSTRGEISRMLHVSNERHSGNGRVALHSLIAGTIRFKVASPKAVFPTARRNSLVNGGESRKKENGCPMTISKGCFQWRTSSEASDSRRNRGMKRNVQRLSLEIGSRDPKAPPMYMRVYGGETPNLQGPEMGMA